MDFEIQLTQKDANHIKHPVHSLLFFIIFWRTDLLCTDSNNTPSMISLLRSKFTSTPQKSTLLGIFLLDGEFISKDKLSHNLLPLSTIEDNKSNKRRISL